MYELIANRYRVVAELGRGGMGTVYRAIDTLADDREVALKTIRKAEPITPALALRFKDEFLAYCGGTGESPVAINGKAYIAKPSEVAGV